MSTPDEARPVPRAVVGLIVAACVVLVVAGLRFASYVVAPLFLAFMLAVVIAPMIRRLERVGFPTWLAITCVLVLAIGLLVGFLIVVSLQLAELAQKLPEYQAVLTTRLKAIGSVLERTSTSDQALARTASRSSEALIQTVIAALSSLLSGAVSVVFFLFLLCLMLASRRAFSRTLSRVVPPDRDFHRRFGEYLRQIQIHIRSASNLMSAVVLTSIFAAFRIDFALLWGLLAFVLGYIPNIGLIVACLPAVALAFIQYGLGTALLVLGFAIVLNAAVDNIVIPRFISSRAELPIVIVFLSFIFWGWMFGLLGAIISTPATLMVRAVLDGLPETRGLAQLMTTESGNSRTSGGPTPRARS